MKCSCTLLTMAALVLGLPAAVEAQPLAAGPEIFVAAAGFQSGGSESPRIAVGPDGGFLNSWTDGGSLRVRAVSPEGASLGTSLQLSSRLQSPTGAQLAALGPGRYVAVWSIRSGTGLPFVHSVAARLLDDSGLPLSSTLVLADAGSVLDVAADGAGGFFVAWAVSEAEEVRIRRFDAQGAPMGEGLAVDASRLDGLSATLVPGGGSVLTWFSRGWNTNDPQEITLRVLRPDGTPAGPDIRLPQARLLTVPRVSSTDAFGRFAIAWAALDPAQYRYDVFVRRFAADGQPIENPVPVHTTASGFGATPGGVALRSDGSVLVLWGESSLIGSGPPGIGWPSGGDVLARVLDATGTPMGPAFEVHTAENAMQLEGDVAVTDDGWVVSWSRVDAQVGIYARRYALTCGFGNTLCLNNRRFRAEVRWRTSPDGPEGEGRPVGLTSDTGAFWSFDPANLELIVKVLDGTDTNGHFWVFYGSLSDVAYELTITDTVTGVQRTYANPAGTLASRADTEAFPSDWTFPATPAFAPRTAEAASDLPVEPACGPGPALCLNDGRFRVEAAWHVPATGARGQGQPAGITNDTGALWFFDPANLELMVKVLDGRGVNGHFWVFFGSLTDVEFDLTVTDTLTGQRRTYHNPAGTLVSRADTEAF